MRGLRAWLTVLTVFWLLVGIGLMASDDSDYRKLADEAGAGDVPWRALAGMITVLCIVAFLSLVAAYVAARKPQSEQGIAATRRAATLTGLTIILFGLLGLLLATSASQARCPVIGFMSTSCGDAKRQYESGGYFLFVIGSASIVLLLILIVTAGLVRRPQPAAPAVEAEVLRQLSELGKLRESGVLTEEEFTARKRAILGGPG